MHSIYRCKTYEDDKIVYVRANTNRKWQRKDVIAAILLSHSPEKNRKKNSAMQQPFYFETVLQRVLVSITL
jgi:hypothetical protein